MNFDKIAPSVQYVELTNWVVHNAESISNKVSYTYRFLIFTEGGFTLRSGALEETCAAGDVIYLPARCEYITEFPESGFSCVQIAFDMMSEEERVGKLPAWFVLRSGAAVNPDWFSNVVTFDDAPEFNRPFVVHNFPGAITRARRCLELWNSPERFARLTLNAALTELIADMAGYFDNAKTHSRSVVAARIADYVETHCTDRLTCQRVADAFAYHPSYVSRIIREHYGCSLHDLIIRAKIRSATQLLMESDMSITDIAYNLSFYDSSHFTKTYFEVTGRNPSDVRKKIL